MKVQQDNKAPLPWYRLCPKCEPTRILNIERVIPVMFSRECVITYKCLRCGHQEDALED